MWLSISEGFQDKLALNKQIATLLGLEISRGGQGHSESLGVCHRSQIFSGRDTPEREGAGSRGDGRWLRYGFTSVINGGNPHMVSGQRVLEQLENLICPVCKTRGLARRQKLREAVELDAGTFKTHHLKTLSGLRGWSKGLAELPEEAGWLEGDCSSCCGPRTTRAISSPSTADDRAAFSDVKKIQT